MKLPMLVVVIHSESFNETLNSVNENKISGKLIKFSS